MKGMEDLAKVIREKQVVFLAGTQYYTRLYYYLTIPALCGMAAITIIQGVWPPAENANRMRTVIVLCVSALSTALTAIADAMGIKGKAAGYKMAAHEVGIEFVNLSNIRQFHYLSTKGDVEQAMEQATTKLESCAKMVPFLPKHILERAKRKRKDIEKHQPTPAGMYRLGPKLARPFESQVTKEDMRASLLALMGELRNRRDECATKANFHWKVHYSLLVPVLMAMSLVGVLSAALEPNDAVIMITLLSGVASCLRAIEALTRSESVAAEHEHAGQLLQTMINRITGKTKNDGLDCEHYKQTIEDVQGMVLDLAQAHVFQTWMDKPLPPILSTCGDGGTSPHALR